MDRILRFGLDVSLDGCLCSNTGLGNEESLQHLFLRCLF